MTVSIVSSSVNADPSVTTYKIKTSNPKNEVASQAINIGNLDEESAVISVSDQGSAASGAVSTTFSAQNGTVSLSENFNDIVQKAAARFQLVDSQGTVIADNQGTTAQKTAYDEWMAGTLQISTGKYTATATPDFGTPAFTISSMEQQGTSLSVNSSLTGSDTSEYYNFSLSGANMKLNFDAEGSNATRVQILNSNGNVVADSEGNSFEKANYAALTSGTGLSSLPGDYTAKVSYAPNADTTQPVSYNFQLYSGNSYAVIYQNTIATPAYDNTAAGSVTATSDAQLFSANQFNQISGTALTGVTIGWLQQDKSALDVLSQLTSADSHDYYSLTLQQGDNLKFGFNTKTTTDPSALRVQLYNSTGTRIIADSEGTAAQQAAYQELTTTNGLPATPGGYSIKISYANGASKVTTPYEFGVYSGTGYSAEYKTIASAQTYGNALLSGEITGGGAPASAIASYLTAQSTGTGDNALSAALSSMV